MVCPRNAKTPLFWTLAPGTGATQARPSAAFWKPHALRLRSRSPHGCGQKHFAPGPRGDVWDQEIRVPVHKP